MVELMLAEEVLEAELDPEPEQGNAANLCYWIPWVGVKVYGFDLDPVLPKKGDPGASDTILTGLEYRLGGVRPIRDDL